MLRSMIYLKGPPTLLGNLLNLLPFLYLLNNTYSSFANKLFALNENRHHLEDTMRVTLHGLLLLQCKGRVSSQEKSEFWCSKLQRSCGRTEARKEGLNIFIRDVKRINRRKFTAEERASIVLEDFRHDTPSETSVVGNAFGPAPTMPASKISLRLAKKG